MKRTILFGTMLSAALATGLSAQTPQTSGAGSTDPQSPNSPQMIITGCLKSGDSSSSASTGGTPTGTSGATGTAGAATAGGGYILTNATAGSAPSATGATGSTGSATGAATAGTSGSTASYKLQGGAESDLSKYVNSQVEIRGTLASSSSSSSAGSSTAGGATGSTSSSRESSVNSNLPTLRVSSVRQIASSCSQ
jgi:hypothetical protein